MNIPQFIRNPRPRKGFFYECKIMDTYSKKYGGALLKSSRNKPRKIRGLSFKMPPQKILLPEWPTMNLIHKKQLIFSKKLKGKNIEIAFMFEGALYIYPHDRLLEKAFNLGVVLDTVGWVEFGLYHVRTPSRQMIHILEPFKIPTNFIEI